jgi:hypothetical protein
MTRAPKKTPQASSKDEQPATPAAATAKAKVQFGPTPSAPGSRLKKGKGS